MQCKRTVYIVSYFKRIYLESIYIISHSIYHWNSIIQCDQKKINSMQLLLLYKKSTGNKKHCHYHKPLARKFWTHPYINIRTIYQSKIKCCSISFLTFHKQLNFIAELYSILQSNLQNLEMKSKQLRGLDSHACFYTILISLKRRALYKYVTKYSFLKLKSMDFFCIKLKFTAKYSKSTELRKI